jgi:hypothetical protein
VNRGLPSMLVVEKVTVTPRPLSLKKFAVVVGDIVFPPGGDYKGRAAL